MPASWTQRAPWAHDTVPAADVESGIDWIPLEARRVFPRFGLPTNWVRGSSGYISGTGTEYDLFAQDRWKIRRNLTMTLGLRYEYNSLITDKYNHFGSFDFNKGLLLAAGTSAASLLNFVGTTGASGLPIGQFEQVGTENLGSTSENRTLQRPDHTDFGPRLGLAWMPFGNEKTVIRAGGGVYYDQMVGQLYFQKSFNPPFFQLTQGDLLDNERAVLTAVSTPPSAGGLPLATGLLLQNLFVAPSLTQALFPALDPVNLDVKDARILEWSSDVQRQLSSWLLDVGYVGTQGLRLPFERDPNQPNNTLYRGGSTALPARLRIRLARGPTLISRRCPIRIPSARPFIIPCRSRRRGTTAMAWRLSAPILGPSPSTTTPPISGPMPAQDSRRILTTSPRRRAARTSTTNTASRSPMSMTCLSERRSGSCTTRRRTMPLVVGK